MARRRLALLGISIACALLLGGVLYLRLGEAGALARVGLLGASVAMAVLMVRFAGRAGGSQR